jgi:hypothetical protein
MRNKSCRRVTMTAGALLAGAAIPVAAAANAWAQDEIISYDGKVIYDTFPDGPAAGASDLGTPALSGANNDTATYIGPAGDYDAAAAGAAQGFSGANDAYSGDANDQATVIDVTGQSLGAADVKNATWSTAYSTSGGWAAVVNNSTGTVEFDHASATGSGSRAAVDNFAPSGTVVAGDGAYATNGGLAFVTDNGTGNVQSDVATADGTDGVARIFNDGGTQAVQGDYATANMGEVAIGNDGLATVPVDFDSGTALQGGVVDIVDKVGQFMFQP